MNDPIQPKDHMAALRTRASLLGRLKDLQDNKSWREFFDTYWRLIYRFALAKGLSEDDAEEVVQDVVIVVWKKIEDFEYNPQVAKFRTWLFAIANNRVRKMRSGRKSMPHPVKGDALEDGVASMLEQIPDPASLEPDPVWEMEWEQNVFAAATERAKKRASSEDFQRYEYLVIQGHSAEETARDLDCALGTVYSSKHRVMTLIKKEVERLRKSLY